jgi:hypothetical protein
LWLKPVLQKLDFGVGQFLQRIKDNHGNVMRTSASRQLTDLHYLLLFSHLYLYPPTVDKDIGNEEAGRGQDAYG